MLKLYGFRGNCFYSLGFASLLILGGSFAQSEAMDLNLDASHPSPQPLGTGITWVAYNNDESAPELWYRFRWRETGQDFQTIRDFGPESTLDWTAYAHEGSYEIEVTAQDRLTGEIAAQSVLMQFSPLARESPVISPTAHPMVYLYSAPACKEGNQMRINIRSADGETQQTPALICDGVRTMNTYLAGLRANASYTVQHLVDTGSSIVAGPALSLTTGEAPMAAPVSAVTGDSAQRGFILHCPIFPNPQFATDLSGNLVWFYPGNISFITRPAAGGRFFGVINSPGDESQQRFRVFDLAGMTLKETNAARINDQLVALGRRRINAFHHEARQLSDGKMLVLAGVEQVLSDVQGDGPVDVLGDMILVLDDDLRVVWAWDSFDYLDVRRKAVLGEKCSIGSCPPLYQASDANDWTHGNAVQETPDGALLYSARHQDWLIKIDYNSGVGSGDVIWRLGKDGDFQIDSADPYPWFSHQHDGEFIDGDPGRILLYDNGNTRHAADPQGNSRGQALQLDEASRRAQLILNADLGLYSFALGTAQHLRNGNYHFESGWLMPENASLSTEIDPSGKIVYSLKVSQPVYRSFRLRDLYSGTAGN